MKILRGKLKKIKKLEIFSRKLPEQVIFIYFCIYLSFYIIILYVIILKHRQMNGLPYWNIILLMKMPSYGMKLPVLHQSFLLTLLQRHIQAFLLTVFVIFI